MSTQTKRMNERKDDTPGVTEAAQNVLDKAISTAQDAIFGPHTSDKPSTEPAETPADPRLQETPKTNIEEALRDQHRSEPPKELLAEANVARREQEREKEEGVEGGGDEVKAG